MKAQFATISKIGRRVHNEDAFLVINQSDDQRWTGILCDGMGATAFGIESSESVLNSIANYWKKHTEESDSKEKVIHACKEAGRALNKKAYSLSFAEMGTTMVMASLEGDTLTVAHVGDSRCYVRRPNEGLLYQTEDHVSIGTGRLKRCFFSFRQSIAVPDVVQMKVKSGDRILLCSDGIYKSLPSEYLHVKMMDDKDLDEILKDFDSYCEQCGDDNYTAIIAVVS